MTTIALTFLKKVDALLKSTLCFPSILATVLQSSDYELLKAWVQNIYVGKSTKASNHARRMHVGL